VEYLCADFCAGRATGTRGSSEAAIYIYRRMRDLGLEVHQQPFLAGNIIGHNIYGILQGTEPNLKPVIVMAYYDGFGAFDDRYLPGADCNASGVAAMLEMVNIFGTGNRRTAIFVAMDAHNLDRAGAEAFTKLYPSAYMVINLDILGSDLAPVERTVKNYMIVLGGQKYASSLETLNFDGLSLTYDYYGSRNFTDVFYKDVSDHKYYLRKGIPCLMFTSGITRNTNNITDKPKTLNYPLFEQRVKLIGTWGSYYVK